MPTGLALSRLSLLLLLDLLFERSTGADAVVDLQVRCDRPRLPLQTALQVIT